MKAKYIIGIILIICFFVFGALSFKKSLTPYVSFKEAKSSGNVVQIIGEVDLQNAQYDTAFQKLRFPLVDPERETLHIVYDKAKPANFEQATNVVVIGKYQDGEFVADQILVKCPSKYQGVKK